MKMRRRHVEVAWVLGWAVTACGNASSWTPLVLGTEPQVVTFGATDLKVNGARFERGATVFWNGQARPTTFLDSTALQATLDPAATQIAGDAFVAVVNPESLASNGLKVTVAVPKLESISPISVPAGSPEFTLALTGTGFLSASQATWNGTVLATQYVSSTMLTAQVPALLVGALGSSSSVAVTTPTPCPRNSPPPCALISEAAVFTVGGTEPGLGLKIVRQPAGGVEWSPIHRMLFVSFPKNSGFPAQAVSAFDPFQGTIAKSVPVGDPALLRVSDDGGYLYVVSRSNSSSTISRFKLPGLETTSWSFSATAAAGGGVNASVDDVQVAPGSPGTVAIGFNGGRVIILDDAVPRPQLLPAGYYSPRSLQWGFDNTRLFAGGSSGLLVLSVDAAGVASTPATGSSPRGRIHYDRVMRLIYDDAGDILFAEDGNWHGHGFLRNECLAAPDGALGKMFFACRESTQGFNVYRLTFEAFDIANPAARIGSVVVNGASADEYALQLVRWGTNGLALATSANLYVYSGLLVH